MFWPGSTSYSYWRAGLFGHTGRAEMKWPWVPQYMHAMSHMRHILSVEVRFAWSTCIGTSLGCSTEGQGMETDRGPGSVTLLGRSWVRGPYTILSPLSSPLEQVFCQDGLPVCWNISQHQLIFYPHAQTLTKNATEGFLILPRVSFPGPELH